MAPAQWTTQDTDGAREREAPPTQATNHIDSVPESACGGPQVRLELDLMKSGIFQQFPPFRGRKQIPVRQLLLTPAAVNFRPKEQVLIHFRKWHRDHQVSIRCQSVIATAQNSGDAGDVVHDAVGIHRGEASLRFRRLARVGAADPAVDPPGLCACHRLRVEVNSFINLLEHQRAESAVAAPNLQNGTLHA